MIVEEPPLDPGRPIIDPHLHLWEILPTPGAPQLPHRFLLPELLETIERSGHNITHSVFVECYQMYRADGPPEYSSLGETEFANGVAAMSASGRYGPRRIAHRIVSSADFRLGRAIAPVIDAHRRAASERFRGMRFGVAYSEAGMFGWPCDPSLNHAMRSPAFREAAAALAACDLSLDVWCYHTQLDELIEVARALPQLVIVLDHVGTPETLGAWTGREGEARADWTAKIVELARCPNVRVKLGGLGMDVSRAIGSEIGAAPSAALAEQWRPYFETCIEAFSPDRAMFQSNFPPDNAAGSYGAVWNAFKIIAAGCSDAEKDRLFRGTAAEVYRIDLA